MSQIIVKRSMRVCPKVPQTSPEVGEGLPSKVSNREGTPTVTGKFEVSVGDKLIHSKKNGDGYVDTGAKEQKIMDAIKAML